jgi:hypothetical protein
MSKTSATMDTLCAREVDMVNDSSCPETVRLNVPQPPAPKQPAPRGSLPGCDGTGMVAAAAFAKGARYGAVLETR